jgi:hypothetical protein
MFISHFLNQLMNFSQNLLQISRHKFLNISITNVAAVQTPEVEVTLSPVNIKPRYTCVVTDF